MTDLAAAYEGAPCPRCDAPLRLARGVEVGNIFKLGTRYSHALGATFLDEQGRQQDIVMGSYGIGVGRLMACVAEACHDERGLVWPASVAPYTVYLVGLNLEDEAVRERAEGLYRDLRHAGVEVLYDDRPERAGVKFNDAELLGIPLRLTLSRRTLERGAVELVNRAGGEPRQVPLTSALTEVSAMLTAL